VTRIFTGADGQTHAEDTTLKLRPGGAFTEVSEMAKASGVQFRRQEPHYFEDWHTAPRKQYVVTLSGRGEIELADGKKIQLGPGRILLAEDLTGKGHISRGVGSEERNLISHTGCRVGPRQGAATGMQVTWGRRRLTRRCSGSLRSPLNSKNVRTHANPSGFHTSVRRAVSRNRARNVFGEPGMDRRHLRNGVRVQGSYRGDCKEHYRSSRISSRKALRPSAR
jgi:hypothetical protein